MIIVNENSKNKNKVGAVVSVGAGGVTGGGSVVATNGVIFCSIYKFRCNG